MVKPMWSRGYLTNPCKKEMRRLTDRKVDCLNKKIIKNIGAGESNWEDLRLSWVKIRNSSNGRSQTDTYYVYSVFTCEPSKW